VPSAFSHAAAALSIGAWFYRPDVPKRVWTIGALCSAFPDVDVIGFSFGIRYGDFIGHRGFTHSLVFVAGSRQLVDCLCWLISFWQPLVTVFSMP
jgi:inner membrane protein